MVDDNTRKKINQTILKYVECLKKEYNIKGIYLYGSYAKGNNTEDSDIDIAVVSEDFTGDIIEDMFRLMKLRRKVDYRIEPHPFAFAEFNEDNPSAKEVMQTGIKIM